MLLMNRSARLLITIGWLTASWDQWRNNRACKACSARGPCPWGAQNLPDAVFLKFFWGEEGALLEYLHAGPLQPCYATAWDRYSTSLIKQTGQLSALHIPPIIEIANPTAYQLLAGVIASAG